MKRNIVILTLVGTIGASIPLLVGAEERPTGVNVPPAAEPPGCRPHHADKRHELMSELLGLSQEQKVKVQELVEEERKAGEPVRRNLADARKKLDELARAERFDEAAVRKLAAAQESARTELLVSMARTQNRIMALLSPEQRERAVRMHRLTGGGHGHGSGDGMFMP